MVSKMRKMRIKNKMTQSEVARKLGISTVAYHMYETGKRSIPKIKADKLAEIYGVDKNDIFLPNSFSIR